jgi:carbonic anhydrase/acetyltransferase-like protein (isoleucine patch superfamily)
MPIYALGDRVPSIHPDAFVHPDATIIGAVTVGAYASIWPQAVLRGDYGPIEVGERTSVQDGTVVHAGEDFPTIIGANVVIGHAVHLEGCTIEPWAQVGSGSVVLHHCVVRSHSVVGANAVVPNRTEVPTGAMALGVPCVIKPDRVAPFYTRDAVEAYVWNASRYKADLRLIDAGSGLGFGAGAGADSGFGAGAGAGAGAEPRDIRWRGAT